jgi:bla regulator protein blaR1
VHHETRELPVYELVIAKNGPRLNPSVPHPTSLGQDNHTVAFGAVLPTQSQTAEWRGIRRVGRGSAKAQRETIGTFVSYFLQDRPEIGNQLILDKTGLKGEYDFTLHWLPEGESPRDLSLSPPEESWPSLFTALQEQLGLKLESTKGPVDVIVIDSVEMPSEN